MTGRLGRSISTVWERDGSGARALAPLSWMYGAITRVRNLAYDLGVLRSHSLGLPTVSVGNLTVGGTGKTPVAAWIAQRLIASGLRPAILLRGYGDDEPLVHAHLTPGVLVEVDPDRLLGAARARAAGAEVLVLDDAFQHRRARRDVDLVLVSTEQAQARRVLPAGPLRESVRGLARASALVMTRKIATLEEAESAAADLRSVNPGLPFVIAALCPGALVVVETEPGMERDELPLNWLAGRRVLAISAIGAPAAFEAQLSRLGASVESAAFPDHHPFSDAEIADLAERATGVDIALCTLKDAVKIQDRWPRQAPRLWYLSLIVAIERGEEVLDELLGRLRKANPR